MPKPRTLLFCSQTASAIGGVENWLDKLCEGLDRRTWRPVVALVRGSKVHNPEHFKAQRPDMETVEIDGRGLAQDGRVRAVMRCVREVNPAVFIPLVVADAHTAAARLRASDARTRYLLTLHGNTALQLLEARGLIPYADFAVGPGALTTRLLASLGMPDARLRHIPNGAKDPVAARTERQAGAPLRLGYVGRLTSADKRVHDMVRLMAALEACWVPFEFTIAGDGPEREALATALARYPVRFLGAQTAEQLYNDVYPNLDALLLFSESEAFGIALVEALLHGVVPVTSAFVGCASEAIVEHDLTGLVFPVGDTDAAAAAILRLWVEPQTLERLSTSGQRRVSGRYTWPVCVDAWGQAFEQCLALPAREVLATATAPAMKAPGGRLDRLGMPSAVSDMYRRVRRQLLGVPDGMHGGEEWPWTTPNRNQEELAAIQGLRTKLDQPPGAAGA